MVSFHDVIANASHRLIVRLWAGRNTRGASLLLVGAEGDLEPDWFWQYGFNVSVIDSPAAISRATHDGSYQTSTYFFGSADSLPFENGCFDYAILNHQLFKAGPGKKHEILQEALRVASKSVFILEWNKCFSKRPPAGWRDGALEKSCSSRVPGAYPWELASFLRRCCPERKATWLSTMLLGDRCQKGVGERLLHPLQSVCLPLPLGALICVRLDWESTTGSALMLFTQVRKRLLAEASGREGVLGRTIENGSQRNKV